ncbi:MAG: hypothetical protein P3W87_006345 [Gammaproteobacteria bacterium]|nr:hypothetical protein [Gammaproteobacteria bacterium]
MTTRHPLIELTHASIAHGLEHGCALPVQVESLPEPVAAPS